MSKISFILGTRPEAIKLAPLIKKFREEDRFFVEVCSTGQHKEMLEQVLKIFDIEPEVNLGLMTYNQSLPDFLSSSIKELYKYVAESSPDFLIVQGDTSTVLAASIASFYNKVKVLHVEAGLRTSDLYSPYPEEMNRRLATQLTFMHFAPTENARKNLLREGVEANRILVTGNTSIDALLQVKAGIDSGGIVPKLDASLERTIEQFDKMVLITGHRRENFGNGFANICEAIKIAASAFPNCLFLYPVHLNPNVQKVVYERLGSIPNIKLIPPQGYVEFISLMLKSTVILTDSGGVQEEGPSLNKPILIMRENTERPEGVEAGFSRLVGTSVKKITEEISRLLTDKTYYNSFTTGVNPYGNGTASERIFKAILQTTQ